ncbi:MAG: hypothetical protein V9G09_14605 [Candidatus Nanopelagicales bacterium]
MRPHRPAPWRTYSNNWNTSTMRTWPSALGDVEADLRAVYARRAAVIAVVHDRIHEMGHRVSGAVATVAAITVTSARSAGYLMDTSLGIVDRPAVWTALADGTIDHTRAQVIVDGLIQLDDPDRGLLEAKALTYAASHTAHQTRRYVARLLVDHRPDLADDARRQRAGQSLGPPPPRGVRPRPRHGRPDRLPTGRHRPDPARRPRSDRRHLRR